MHAPRLLLMACLLTLASAGGAWAQSLWPAAGLATPIRLDPAHPPPRPAPPPPALAAVTPPPAPPAAPMVLGASSGQQCRQAIRTAERAARIPDQLMAAIARVESGRREADGSVNPWPWSINAEGVDHIFESKAAAIAAVQTLQQQGVRSIDVGCMQVNLLHHPDAFASLDDAFDPARNAAYAARFLLQLYGQTGSWPAATAWYHSATPELGADYQRKVMAVWPDELRLHPDRTGPSATADWAARPATVAGFVSVSHALAPHVIPQPSGTDGRALAAYRAAPIPLASRPPPKPQPPAGLPG